MIRFPTPAVLLAALLLPLAACAPSAELLLPVPASVRGANMVSEIEVVASPAAAPTLARLNGTATPEGAQAAPAPASPAPAAPVATVPFEQMLSDAILEATRRRGLTSGRALKLRVEIEALQTANAASAVIGRDDRLEGSVYVRDAASGAPLGQLYITIVNSNGGLMSALLRLRGVREQLVGAFAEDIAKALAAPDPRR